jgi:hypothetical protein
MGMVSFWKLGIVLKSMHEVLMLVRPEAFDTEARIASNWEECGD